MTVNFYNIEKDAAEVIENVVLMDGHLMQIDGRLTNVWLLHLEDGTERAYRLTNYLLRSVKA